MTLDELVTQLKAAHGDALLGVVVYGSTATDPAAKSGHNVLVVVRALDVKALQASGAIGRSWQEAGNAVPLTMTDAEWQSSADVFAIEHADIADRNRVLHAAGGFAVMPRASISDADIRSQLEYEALAMLLAVRGGIAAVGRDAKEQRALLGAQASRAVALFRAGIRLSGADPAAEAVGVCTQAGSLAGFDSGPFAAALGQRRGTAEIPKSELDAVLGGFHAGLMKFVAHIDDQSVG